MGAFLEKFRSTLSTTQAKQLSRLIRSKRDIGEISTLQEFTDELAKLTKELKEGDIHPTLKIGRLREKSGDIIFSERYNEALKRVRDDLETAFVEATNIAEVHDSHNAILFLISLNSLRKSVSELENKLRELRFLAGSEIGLTEVQANTFASYQQLSSTRGDPSVTGFYLDPKTQTSLNANEEAVIDQIGERLGLPPENKEYVRLLNIEHILDDGSPESELQVQYPGNDITRAIDGNRGTFWLYSILRRAALAGGIAARFRIILPGATEVSFVEIEPAAPRPMALTQIAYLDRNSIQRVVFSGNTPLRGPVSASFPSIVATELYITIRQENYQEIQFETRADQPGYFRAATGVQEPPATGSIEAALRDTFSASPVILEAFPVPLVPQPNPTARYLDYLIGFDNIRIGRASYRKRGVYVSRPLDVEKATALVLRTVESRPLGTSFLIAGDSQESATGFFHGSIEYYVAKRDRDATKAIIRTDLFPVRPSNQAGTIRHERLLLTIREANSTSNNAGRLSFHTTTPGDIQVFRNGTLLPYNVVTTTDGWRDRTDPAAVAAGTVAAPGLGSRMAPVLIINRPSQTDVYTVSYTPVVSNTFFTPLTIDTSSGLGQIVDLTGDFSTRMCRNNIVSFSLDRAGQQVATSEIYLIILIRSNSPIEDMSPFVEEYFLGIAETNLERMAAAGRA